MQVQLISMLQLLFLLLLLEVVFRLYVHKLKPNSGYMKRISYKELYFQNHPYLPFVMKKGVITDHSKPATYPLHKGKFFFGQFRTNNYGFLSGRNGDLNVVDPKPKHVYRVCCLGASTTGNYIIQAGEPYSYPLELQKLFDRNCFKINNKSVEIVNCGQGGYNSADIVIRFMLQIIDMDPDMIILYHGYNDIRDYLTCNFISDYSHSRRSLKVPITQDFSSSILRYIPLAFIRYLIIRFFMINSQSLLSAISSGQFMLTNDETKGLKAYKRNIQTLVDICKGRDIEIILSTYCHFLYDEIKDSNLHGRYSNIVRKENYVLRSISDDNNLKLVDNDLLIERIPANFVDSIHFTPEGMKILANNIFAAMCDVLKSKS